MHSRQLIENTLHLLKMKEYAAEIKYLYSIINKSLILKFLRVNRVLYIFDEAEKIFDTKGIKLKGHKSFLNHNLTISEIFNCWEEEICHP